MNEALKNPNPNQKFNNSVGKILKIFSSTELNEDANALAFTKLLEAVVQLKTSIGDASNILIYINRAIRAFKDLDDIETSRVMSLIKNLYLKNETIRIPELTTQQIDRLNVLSEGK